MLDRGGKSRGRCKQCACEEYLRPNDEHTCGRCAHQCKDHVLLEIDAAPAPGGSKAKRGLNLRPPEKVAKQQKLQHFNIHFQNRTGKPLEIRGLVVHKVEPEQCTPRHVIIECQTLAGCKGGQLLAGSKGPEITECDPLKFNMWFRKKDPEDSSKTYDLEAVDDELRQLLQGPRPPPIRKLVKPSTVICGTLSQREVEVDDDVFEVEAVDIAQRSNPQLKPADTEGEAKPRDGLARYIKVEGMSNEEKSLKAQVDEVARKQKELEKKKEEVEKKQKNMARKEQEIARKEEEIARKDADLARKEEEMASKKEEIASKEKEAITKPDDILTKELHDVTLGAEIEEGGEGVVYHAMWLTTPVAAKVIRGRYNTDILEECKKLQKLSHPNIVQFYGLATVKPGKVGMVVEICMCDLLTYSERTYATRQNSKLQPTQASLLSYTKDAINGLCFVHEKGFIHLDIKPSNILIKGDVGKLADFGMAELVASLKPQATNTCTWPGTAMFRAPELWETRHSPTQAADIWSVGLTLLRVMTNKQPFQLDPKRKDKPEALKKRILPQNLSMVGGKNRALYERAINFDHTARATAKDFLLSLSNYVIQDGS